MGTVTTADEVWKRALNPTIIKSPSVPQAAPNDPVKHPSHYTQYQGLEIIDLVKQMNYCKGNAVKYIARAGFKNPDTEIQDLEKAIQYLEFEIERIKHQP